MKKLLMVCATSLALMVPSMVFATPTSMTFGWLDVTLMILDGSMALAMVD